MTFVTLAREAVQVGQELALKLAFYRSLALTLIGCVIGSWIGGKLSIETAITIVGAPFLLAQFALVRERRKQHRIVNRQEAA